MTRRTHVFHRTLAGALPVAVSASGSYVVDSEGRRYLDASGGAAVSCFGHGDPEVLDAIRAQLDRVAYVHSAFFTTEALEELAETLVAVAPGALDHVWFVSGGSEAMEAAVKLARQAAVERGEPNRRWVIGRRQSYHGSTLGALAVGHHAWRRAPFEPLLIRTQHIEPCYAYRHRREGETLEAYGQRAATALAEKITELGPGNVLAFVAETVVGAAGGAIPPAPGYFRRIREICDEAGALLVLDEVMCGMGRTGTMFACEQDGIVPDLVAVSKGLGAGYQPIGAVLVARAVYEAIRRGSGAFRHGHTFMGHATACAAALAVLAKLRDRETLARVRALGAGLDAALRARLGAHPHVGDIRGRGLLRGIELVADRATKRPFAPSLQLAARLKAAAMARGLICYPGSGTADGERGDHVLLAPPYNVSNGEIEEIVTRLAAALDDALAPAVAA